MCINEQSHLYVMANECLREPWNVHELLAPLDPTSSESILKTIMARLIQQLFSLHSSTLSPIPKNLPLNNEIGNKFRFRYWGTEHFKSQIPVWHNVIMLKFVAIWKSCHACNWWVVWVAKILSRQVSGQDSWWKKLIWLPIIYMFC